MSRIPWKLGVDVNVIRSIPTKVLGGRCGVKSVGVGLGKDIVDSEVGSRSLDE